MKICYTARQNGGTAWKNDGTGKEILIEIYEEFFLKYIITYIIRSTITPSATT